MFDPCLGCLPLEQGLKVQCLCQFFYTDLKEERGKTTHRSFFLFLAFADPGGAITASGDGMSGASVSTSWPVIVYGGFLFLLLERAFSATSLCWFSMSS